MDVLEAQTIHLSDQLWAKYVDWCERNGAQAARIGVVLKLRSRTQEWSVFGALNDADKAKVGELAMLALAQLHIQVASKTNGTAESEKP